MQGQACREVTALSGESVLSEELGGRGRRAGALTEAAITKQGLEAEGCGRSSEAFAKMGRSAMAACVGCQSPVTQVLPFPGWRRGALCLADPAADHRGGSSEFPSHLFTSWQRMQPRRRFERKMIKNAPHVQTELPGKAFAQTSFSLSYVYWAQE